MLQPFSFIRTLTVGFGITPNLLTLPPARAKSLAGAKRSRAWATRCPYRRWGIAPRPENISRRMRRPCAELWRMTWLPASVFGSSTGHFMALAHLGRRFGEAPAPRFRHKELTIAARAESDSDLFSKSTNGIHDLLWTAVGLVVDGVRVQLRGFRKSHQLIRADP